MIDLLHITHVVLRPVVCPALVYGKTRVSKCVGFVNCNNRKCRPNRLEAENAGLQQITQKMTASSTYRSTAIFSDTSTKNKYISERVRVRALNKHSVYSVTLSVKLHVGEYCHGSELPCRENYSETVPQKTQQYLKTFKLITATVDIFFTPHQSGRKFSAPAFSGPKDYFTERHFPGPTISPRVP